MSFLEGSGNEADVVSLLIALVVSASGMLQILEGKGLFEAFFTCAFLGVFLVVVYVLALPKQTS